MASIKVTSNVDKGASQRRQSKSFDGVDSLENIRPIAAVESWMPAIVARRVQLAAAIPVPVARF
jgi:hypothetical protein